MLNKSTPFTLARKGIELIVKPQMAKKVGLKFSILKIINFVK